MVFTCIRCNTKFEAKRKSLICPNCKIQKCIICGKEFELKHPYIQKTCSSKCRGIYRKESGIAKSSRIKAEETFRSKYDDLGKPRYMLEAKKCAYCGNDFIPNSPRQVYCDNDHYGPCPVCGKPVKISDMSVGPQCCSKSCIQIQTRKTNKSKYGTEFYFQSDDFSKKSKDTNRIKYGYESYQSTPEFKQRYNYTIKSKYGVSAPIQFPEFKEKSKTTCNQKYGTDWAMQSEVVKDKVRTTAAKHGGFTYQRPELVQKLQLTNFAKYGDTCPVRTKHIQAKIQDTNLKKYGTKYVLCKGSPIRSKVEATNLEKYGSITPFGNKSIQESAKQSIERIYGVDNVFKSEDMQSKIRNTLRKKYGVDNPMKLEVFKKKCIDTNISKYGAAYWGASKSGILSRMQDPTKYELFVNFKSNPVQYIQTMYGSNKPTLHQLGLDVGVDIATISKYILESGCEYLISYNKSTMEYDVYEYIKSLDDNIKIIRNDRSIIAPHELDLYFPEYNFAIECNPTYTHNSSAPTHWNSYITPKTYHRDKSIKCSERGIQLLHLYSCDWKYRTDIIKSMICNLLHKNTNIYYARKLEIKEVPDSESYRFLQKNHIQGYTTAKVRIGLYASDTLISIMTFSRPRYTAGFRKDYDANTWELTRFCTTLYSTCVGGASKLFNYFIRTYCPGKIISFSDIGMTTGNVYSILGFIPVNTIAPNYRWVNLKTDIALNRLQCQKSKLIKLLGDDSIDVETQTEDQIMESHGFVKVYNSGLVRWVYDNVKNIR